MDIYSLLSFAFAAIILIGGIGASSDNPKEYLDPISMFIVFGGTLAATSISFKIERLFILIKISVARIVKKDTVNYRATIQSIMKLAEAYRKDDPALKNLIQGQEDLFLREAMELLLDETLDHADFIGVLSGRVRRIYQHYLEDANKFKTISKFPPAFGMMGTTIGMISLLGKLGTEDAVKTLGPSMSICMITTLYGVALANLVIIPMSENLLSSARELKIKNEIIAEGVLLIQQKENPIVLAEKLNSHLLPGDRVDWKSMKGMVS